MEFITSFNNYFYTFFRGTINMWNDWIVYLQEDPDAKALVPQDGSRSGHRFIPIPPEAPIRNYTESTFPYNLELLSENQLMRTGNQAVDEYIYGFAVLRIDIVRMILEDHALPDEKFVHKRYLNVQKEVHPDRGGTNEESKDVNVARGFLEKLYEDVQEQIELFQTVFTVQMEQQEEKNTETQPAATAVEVDAAAAAVHEARRNTAAYVILYLAGVGLGSIIVWKRATRKKKLPKHK
jgi:hypothetical protein